MLMVTPTVQETRLDARPDHRKHGDERACMEIRSLVSGMPRDARERARLVVFQAWFDDSGKEGIAQSPVYLLAGYSARIEVWNDFADEWQDELNQTPRLAYLK